MPEDRPGGAAIDVRNLHTWLVPRIGDLQRYVERRIPPSWRPVLSADQVLGEVWVTVCRRIGEFEPIDAGAFDRWLQKIVHSQLVDAVRHARRLKRGGDQRFVPDAFEPGSSLTSLFARLPGPDCTPSREVSRRETAAAVTAALQDLNPRQRRAAELRYLHALPIRDVALQMQTSEKAVRHLLARGLRRLREALGPRSRLFTRSQ